MFPKLDMNLLDKMSGINPKENCSTFSYKWGEIENSAGYDIDRKPQTHNLTCWEKISKENPRIGTFDGKGNLKNWLLECVDFPEAQFIRRILRYMSYFLNEEIVISPILMQEKPKNWRRSSKDSEKYRFERLEDERLKSKRNLQGKISRKKHKPTVFIEINLLEI